MPYRPPSNVYASLYVATIVELVCVWMHVVQYASVNSARSGAMMKGIIQNVLENG